MISEKSNKEVGLCIRWMEKPGAYEVYVCMQKRRNWPCSIMKKGFKNVVVDDMLFHYNIKAGGKWCVFTMSDEVSGISLHVPLFRVVVFHVPEVKIQETQL